MMENRQTPVRSGSNSIIVRRIDGVIEAVEEAVPSTVRGRL